MYAKTNKMNKISNQLNENINNDYNSDEMNVQLYKKTKEVNNEFYYRKEHENYINKINAHKAFNLYR